MHILLHLLLIAAQQGGGGAANAECPVDFSTFDGDVTAALRAVDLGGRFVVLWRRRAGVTEWSGIVLVPRGSAPPAGWDGGQDVTQRLLVALGCPPAMVAHANQVSQPLAFGKAPPVAGDAPRYTRAGGITASVLVLSVVAFGTAVIWTDQRLSYGTDVWAAALAGGLSAALLAYPLFLVAVWVVGAHLRGGPFAGWKWWPAIGIPVTSPIFAGAVVARLLLQADVDRWTAGLAGLDLETPDRTAGFSVSDPEEMEVESAFVRSAWRRTESVHPGAVPRYRPGDKGVIVEWSAGFLGLAPISLQLPDGLRATGTEEVRWIAYLARPQALAALRWSNGRTTDVTWLNLRIVDVRAGALVAHGTAWSAPPGTATPPDAWSVPDADAVALVAEAIAPSYADP